MIRLLVAALAFGFGSGFVQRRFPGRGLTQRQLSSISSGRTVSEKSFEALLFDCDGVIAETERDAHRVTFNEAFKAKGVVGVEWGVEEYGELLKIGGGKERMTHYFDKNNNWPSFVPEADRKSFIQELHLLKTAKFQSAVEGGLVPLRPGVQRLVDDAFANGITVAVCSTSSVDAVTTIVKTLLGPERLSKMKIFAGDMVKSKKPSPDIYLLASSTLNVPPSKCWVVEDSNIGLRAAKSAGMSCCVTKSIYTADEDFTGGDLVVENLDKGSVDGAITVVYLNYLKKGGYKAQPSTNDNANMFASDKQNLGTMAKKLLDGKGTGFPF